MQNSIVIRLLSNIALRKITIMKKLLYIGLLVGLYSCGPRVYSYKFSMKESIKPQKMCYENDTMSVSFNIYPKGIKMDFVNKSDSAIRINWNEMQITENGSEKKTVHIKRDKGKLKVVEPRTVISPRTKVSELIVYEYNVSYSKKPEREVTIITDMFPVQSKNDERKMVERLVGTRITLQLPIDINNTPHKRTFNFLLEEIRSNRQFSAGDFLVLPLYVLTGL
jgi:hypothetical protein